MNNQTQLARAETRNILPVLLAAAAGLPTRQDAHTRDILSQYRHDDLSAVAELAGFARAQNSSDFAAVMAESLSAILQSNFWPVYQARLESVAVPVALDNFHETTVATISPPDYHEVGEDSESVFSPLTLASATGKLRSFEAIMTVSRQVWSSLGESLVQAVSQLAKSVYELELSLAAEALSGINFASDNSSASALDLTRLDLAMGWLEQSALTPATLMLAPGKTATVKTLLDNAGLNLNIVVNPSLPTGGWFVMANPTEKAALGRLRLRSDLLAGARAPTVQWMRIDSQRLGYFSAVDIGYVGLHREAVYRGGI